MGCSPGSPELRFLDARDTDCKDNEKPAHEVTISNGFWMGQTEVTQQAYQRVMGKNPSSFKGEQLPVETVTWEKATEYCGKVGLRLPTETEWEYAARAGDKSAALGSVAWYFRNSGGKTHVVQSKSANPWGLYDMLGNVEEWVADWYGAYPDGGGIDPKGPSGVRPKDMDRVLGEWEYRVVRGGSWDRRPQPLVPRLSMRRWGKQNGVGPDVGLRCAGASILADK
jgi:formylglycine-generating enzyme required for sulfatase activity